MLYLNHKEREKQNKKGDKKMNAYEITYCLNFNNRRTYTAVINANNIQNALEILGRQIKTKFRGQMTFYTLDWKIV